MDAIHYHVRNEGRVAKRAVYITLGIDLEGHKDVLGMYVGQNERAVSGNDGYHQKMDRTQAGLGTNPFAA